jgi:hypothetical protein
MATKKDYAACHAKIAKAHKLLEQAQILLAEATCCAPRPIEADLNDRCNEVTDAWNNLGLLVK